jgi:choline dehydrogenase-like flavoprotein
MELGSRPALLPASGPDLDYGGEPELRLDFLSAAEDLARARAVVRLLHELATEEAVAAEPGQLLAPVSGFEDDARLDEWLRANVNASLHGACTCRMGPREDPGAVVDQRLAVHETEGLHVADASVTPEVTTSAVNLTCMMIGERLAEFLRADG